jgi:hypothetical protein
MRSKLAQGMSLALAALLVALFGVQGGSFAAQTAYPANPAVLEINEANGWEYISEAEQKVAPISASAVNGCPDDYVCLYAYINYGGGRWQAHVNNLVLGSCWNLSNSTFGTPHLGLNVNNASGSLLINIYDPNDWFGVVAFYNWVDCNPGDGWSGYNTGTTITTVPNLGNTSGEQDYGFGPASGTNNWYRRYTSIKMLQ